MKTDHSSMKLGKHPAQHDSRTLHMANYLAAGLPAPPDQVNYASKIATWPMMRNDRIQDCTVAAAGHMIQQWTTLNGSPKVPSDETIVAAYSAVSGYRPDDPTTDTGIPVLEVLKYWRKTGIGGDKIAGFVALEPKNHHHVMDAVYVFANCQIGLALPNSAKQQSVWSVPQGGTTGDGAVNSWGGHVVAVVGYDSRYLTIVSWGKVMRMTWQFLDTYCDESFAVLSDDWVGKAKGKAPNGFDWNQLDSDLGAVG
jgi:hypothetical protein